MKLISPFVYNDYIQIWIKSILTLFPYIISELCPLDLKENVKDTKINDFLMINYLKYILCTSKNYWYFLAHIVAWAFTVTWWPLSSFCLPICREYSYSKNLLLWNHWANFKVSLNHPEGAYFQNYTSCPRRWYPT